ncbi:MAG: hypothetical protein HFJ45_00060 [Clostridia bacterium]|nr:hypothetical protein [Clostridia bacterium]
MYEKYIEIINANGGIITSKDANKNGISRTILSKMVKNKSIERIDYGIYVTDEFICDELFIFQMKHPNTVFSFNTALYLLNKTERTPEKFDITTTRNNSLGYCKDIANIHRVNNVMIELGKIKVPTNTGKEVSSYNIERTIVDIISNRNIIEIELANKIIRKCIKEKDFNVNLMFEYAKKLKSYAKVKNYMEAII